MNKKSLISVKTLQTFFIELVRLFATKEEVDELYKVEILTQEEYDALDEIDPKIIYIIK